MLVNKPVARGACKPGERRKEKNFKNRQEEFSKVNNTESFPTLGGEGGMKPPKESKPGKVNNKQINKSKNIRKKTKDHMKEEAPRHQSSSPVKPPTTKMEGKGKIESQILMSLT